MLAFLRLSDRCPAFPLCCRDSRLARVGHPAAFLLGGLCQSSSFGWLCRRLASALRPCRFDFGLRGRRHPATLSRSRFFRFVGRVGRSLAQVGEGLYQGFDLGDQFGDARLRAQPGEGVHVDRHRGILVRPDELRNAWTGPGSWRAVRHRDWSHVSCAGLRMSPAGRALRPVELPCACPPSNRSLFAWSVGTLLPSAADFRCDLCCHAGSVSCSKARVDLSRQALGNAG